MVLLSAECHHEEEVMAAAGSCKKRRLLLRLDRIVDRDDDYSCTVERIKQWVCPLLLRIPTPRPASKFIVALLEIGEVGTVLR